MELPKPHVEAAQDEHDFELTPRQVTALDFVDELLKLKEEGSRFTFVDIDIPVDKTELYDTIVNGPLGGVLAASDENLALESDGSYYPIYDIRKNNSKLIGLGLRVWGWDDPKLRYTGGFSQTGGYEYVEYEGQKDRTRQIELSMSYRSNEDRNLTATEELSLYIHSSSPDYFRVSSQVHMMAYAETGYEGHGGKSAEELTGEQVDWILELVARSVGDDPKSVRQVQHEAVERFLAIADSNGCGKGIRKLIKGTWEAQAMYLMSLPLKQLNGLSIRKAAVQVEMAKQANKAAKDILVAYKNYNDRSVFEGMIQKEEVDNSGSNSKVQVKSSYIIET